MKLPRNLILLALTAALSACSALDLGPEPSDFVGQRSEGPQSLTDPELQAITPNAPDQINTDVTPTTMTGGATVPETMPSATQPTTTRPAASTNPATHSALGQGASNLPAPSSQPALGKVDVPAALTVQEAIL